MFIESDINDLFLEAKTKFTAKLLLDNGAQINYKNASGETALSRAVYNENLPLVIFLVEQGADIDYETLENVSEYDNLEIFEYIQGVLKSRSEDTVEN